MWSELKCLAETLPVRPMSSECLCGDLHTNHQRAIAHDDGWAVECLSCHRQWVEFRLSEPGRPVAVAHRSPMNSACPAVYGPPRGFFASAQPAATSAEM